MFLTTNLYFIMQALATSCHIELMLLTLEMLFSDYLKIYIYLFLEKHTFNRRICSLFNS